MVVFDGSPTQLDEDAMDRIYRFDKDQTVSASLEAQHSAVGQTQFIAEGA